jgi:cyclophilin family peptidyl-prolyl cis-trans isomerase
MRVVALTAVLATLIAVGAWAALSGREAANAEAPDRNGVAAEAASPSTSSSTGQPEEPSGEGFTPVAYLAEAPVQRFDAPAQVLDPTLDYRVIIDTTAGRLVADLFETQLPDTVNVFVFLALHRYYQGVPFHRVIDEFMAQTGDPTGTGSGGPGFTFADEIVPEVKHDRPGLLSMANSGPDSNGSQFFVTFGAAPWLDGQHAIFGELIAGHDVLDRLTRVDPSAPSMIATLAEPALVLAEQGLVEAEGEQGTVEDFLLSQLGQLPDPGQSFRVAGHRGVFGAVSGAAAIGLFPVPDRIEHVTVFARPKEDGP